MGIATVTDEGTAVRIGFPERRPILFSFLLVVPFLIALTIASVVSSLLNLPALAMTAIGYSLLTLAMIILLRRLGWWGKIGLGLPVPRRNLWFFTVAFIPVLLNALSNFNSPTVGVILFTLATAMAVGFVEEVCFRGMMLRALLTRGPWQAALISALIFGVAHSFNLLTGANVAATTLQIGYTLAIGFMFAALTLRTRTMLLLIVAHSLTDFFGFLAYNSSVVTTSLSMLVIAVSSIEIVLYIIYGVYLMGQVQAHPAASAREDARPSTAR